MKLLIPPACAIFVFCGPALSQDWMTLGEAALILKPEIRAEITKIHLALGVPKLCGLPVDRNAYMRNYVRQLRDRGEDRRQIKAAELFGTHGTMRFNEVDRFAARTMNPDCSAERKADYAARLKRMQNGDYRLP